MTQADLDAYNARRMASRASKPPESYVDTPSALESLSEANKGSEKALHEVIENWLRLHGVRAIVHSRTDKPTTQAKGVADFLYVIHGKPVAMEVKVGRNQCTPEQVGWLEAAKLDGWLTGVVRSLDEAIALFRQAEGS